MPFLYKRGPRDRSPTLMYIYRILHIVRECKFSQWFSDEFWKNFYCTKNIFEVSQRYASDQHMILDSTRW